jgi:hypothetical protein
MSLSFNKAFSATAGSPTATPSPTDITQQESKPSRPAQLPARPRAASALAGNSALSQLKALGSRLTEAQRTSIAYLEASFEQAKRK